MSADPRGVGNRRWYLEVSGRRAGPFAWAVIVELAQAGALGPDDRIWSMGLANWSRAVELPDLAPLIRRPAPARRMIAGHASEEGAPHPGSPSTQPLLLAAGIAWIVVTICFYVERFELWPSVLDGVLAARLNTAGPLLLLLAGPAVLPGLWRHTRPDALGRSPPWQGGIRVLAGLCVLVLPLTVLSTAVNARPFFLIAIGSDPMGQAQIQLLPGGREVEIRGPLGAGVAARLRALIDTHPGVRFVHLNSPGGWVTEGARLARVIHAAGLGTYTATGCYSACVLGFAAGSPRVLNPDARLGLHSTSGRDADPIFITLGNELYQKVLLRYGVSAELAAWSTSTPSNTLWMPDPQQLLADHLVDRISAEGFSPSGESLAAFASPAARFETRYAFLADLRRVDAPRFDQLDRALRLGFRRGASAAELNEYVATGAADIERRRLAEVADSSVLQFAVALRSAARALHGADPAQCAAILGPRAPTSPVRSAAALAAISPALAGLLDAPLAPRPATAGAHTAVVTASPAALQLVDDAVSQPAAATPDMPDDNPRIGCDRLLLLYDTAVAQSPDTGATVVRGLLGH